MRCLEFHTLTSCISGPQKGHSSFNDNKQTDNVQGSMYYTLELQKCNITWIISYQSS